MQAVIAEPHRPPQELSPNLLRELVEVIDRALAKSSENRFQSAEQMASALRSIQTKLSLPHHPASVNARRQRSQTIAAVAAVLAIGAVGWFTWQWANVNWAQRQLPEIEALARAGRTVEAYDLANRVSKFLPGDTKSTRKLTRLMPVISSTLTVKSEPAGALVYLRRIDPKPSGVSPPRIRAGDTPLEDFGIARGDYVLSVEKEGYVPFRRTYSDRTYLSLDAPIIYPSIPVEIKLTPIADAHEGMVFVPGGDYRLAARRGPIDDLVKLDDYWIDRFEVTNREYKEFVDADGYRNERYWMHEFVKDGRTLSWAEAMLELVDSTGQPGPRSWSNRTFPDGKDDHPVVGITWYEAAAYAAFREKSLPTIFQWENAARFRWKRRAGSEFNNPLGVTMPWGLHEGTTTDRANFGGAGTVPVGSFEFGMSPYGCYDMAGNVSEWCLNETSEGYIASGGSWASIPSAWGFFGIYPGFRSSDEVGFRCVVNSPDATGDQGAMWIDLNNEVPQYTPAPEAEVRKLFAHYEYDNKAPLDSRVIASTQTDVWRREKVEYRGANGERALAYLYLPKHSPAPHQVIHVLPSGSVTYRQRTVPQLIEAEYSEFVRSGRAVFAVVLRGYLERDRPAAWEPPDPDLTEYVDMMAEHVIDLRRGLDYVQTRKDLDAGRIAYMSVSQGGVLMALPAIEPRFGATIFVADGVGNWDLRGHPAVSGINFAPLIRGPKLLLHGRYDESSPLKSVAEPLYNLLQEPEPMVKWDGAHRPDPEFLVPTANQWLDKTFGPVQHKNGPDRLKSNGKTMGANHEF
jgi:formylglycine-generating enzyme required for sulfatase activity